MISRTARAPFRWPSTQCIGRSWLAGYTMILRSPSNQDLDWLRPASTKKHSPLRPQHVSTKHFNQSTNLILHTQLSHAFSNLQGSVALHKLATRFAMGPLADSDSFPVSEFKAAALLGIRRECCRERWRTTIRLEHLFDSGRLLKS